MTEFKKGDKVLVKPGDRIRAVRDTTSEYGTPIPKGATGTVFESAYADLAFRPDDGSLGTSRFIRSEDFERVEEPPEKVVLTVTDNPKMLHETLCVAQTILGRHTDGARSGEHVARL